VSERATAQSIPQFRQRRYWTQVVTSVTVTAGEAHRGHRSGGAVSPGEGRSIKYMEPMRKPRSSVQSWGAEELSSAPGLAIRQPIAAGSIVHPTRDNRLQGDTGVQRGGDSRRAKVMRESRLDHAPLIESVYSVGNIRETVGGVVRWRRRARTSRQTGKLLRTKPDRVTLREPHALRRAGLQNGVILQRSARYPRTPVVV
jgi:hypothetical protein